MGSHFFLLVVVLFVALEVLFPVFSFEVLEAAEPKRNFALSCKKQKPTLLRVLE